MKVKVFELTGRALDWAVAKCEGYESGCSGVIPYSTDWAQGGPIIEFGKIKVDPRKGQWEATIWNEPVMQNPAYASTPLIAAMRCHVASKLGGVVDIPEELT